MEDDRGDDEYDYEYEDEDIDDDYDEIPPGMDSGGSASAAPDRGAGGSSSVSADDDLALRDETVIFLDQAQLKVLMSKVVADISETVNISTDSATALLRYFSWNRERLFDQGLYDVMHSPSRLDTFPGWNEAHPQSRQLAVMYYSAPESVMAKVGIGSEGQPATSLGDSERLTCRICCDEYKGKDAYALACNHLFCRGCWTMYLRAKIQEGPTCVYTTCPEHKCPQIASEAVFKEFLSPEEFERYQGFSLTSFVDINKTLRFCPGKDCGMVVKAPLSYPRSVRCKCGSVFCFRCGEEAHDPASCTELAMWKEKCQNESETANWILANTKQCPKCKTRIEKNQGCNHMTCRQCKGEFCWICMGDWGEHGSTTGGYYKCNKYEAKEGEGDNDVAKAKAELDRYLHYYKRYQAHHSSQQMAERQQDATERRMVELQETSAGSAWIDVQFLKTAVEQLIECRRVLKYTYVLSYYIEEKTPAKELFEHHQENLEKYTERLHELSESPLDRIDRTNVINFTRCTDRFCKSLLRSVKDGLGILPGAEDESKA